jgi:hypothetical protein
MKRQFNIARVFPVKIYIAGVAVFAYGQLIEGGRFSFSALAVRA